MYITVIEWDGKKPPSKFYNRLHTWSMRVRGDKSQSPTARRATNGETSVIIQEGAILSASYSVARAIALLAQEYKCKSVNIGEVDMTENIEATPQDMIVLNRIQAVLGRRGRPTGEKSDWTIVCLEEVRTSTVNSRDPVNCPICQGFSIKIKPGAVVPMSMTDYHHISLIKSWTRTRFATGDFVPPILDPDSPQPPKICRITNDEERKVVDIIAKSNDLLTVLVHKSIGTALRLLDSIFVSRCYGDPKQRADARVLACARAFQLGANPMSVSIGERDDQVDILDAAFLFGSERAAKEYMFAMNGAVVLKKEV